MSESAHRAIVLIAVSLAAAAPSCQPRFSVADLEMVAAESTSGMEVSLEQIDRDRVNRTNFIYSYRVRLRNTGSDAGLVVADVSSMTPSTAVLDGHLRFRNVLANQTVLSKDTLTIRHDRTVPFDPSALVWSFEVDPEQNECTGSASDQMSTLVEDITDDLLAEGVEINGASWANPVHFELVVEALERELDCRFSDPNLALSGQSQTVDDPRAVGTASVGAERPYIAATKYCGPGLLGGPDGGTTGVGGSNPPTRDCLNRACYRHDECYAAGCVRFGCAFSLAGGARSCDLAFFDDLDSCGETDPISLIHPGSVLVRNLATYWALAVSNEANQNSCELDSDRCSGDQVCSLEVCDGQDNDCNGYIDDTVNVTGVWAGDWASDQFSNAGMLNLDLEQVGTRLVGSAILTGTALGTVAGEISGRMDCEEAQLGGAFGNLIATGLEGEFSGSVGFCSGDGTYDVGVNEVGLDSGIWQIERSCGTR